MKCFMMGGEEVECDVIIQSSVNLSMVTRTEVETHQRRRVGCVSASGRKEGRKGGRKEGRKEGGKEGRKGGRREGREEGRKGGNIELKIILFPRVL